jgi:hypothetical protein
MNEEEVVVLMTLFICGAVSIKVIASAMLKHWENKLKYLNSGGAAADRQIAARIERIEQAVDSIAVEVERISENQRFTTKLLSEREGVVLPRRGSH